jgi:hypothetical protein
MATYVVSPRFTGSAFLTRAVGNEIAIPQRTLLNLIFTYNALPDLRRTGYSNQWQNQTLQRFARVPLTLDSRAICLIVLMP